MDDERKVTMAILIFLAAVGTMALFLAVRAPADIEIATTWSNR